MNAPSWIVIAIAVIGVLSFNGIRKVAFGLFGLALLLPSASTLQAKYGQITLWAKKSMQVLAEGDFSQSAMMSVLPDLSLACLALLCSGVVLFAASKGPRKCVGLVAVLLVTLLPGSDIESKLDSAQEQWARLGSALGQWLEGEGTTPLTLTTTGSTSQEALQGEWLAALGALLLLALSSKFPAKTASPHQQSLPLAGNAEDTRIGRRGQSLVGRRSFLCDTCKSNYREACQLDVRPNAIICADYNRLG